MIDTRRIRTIKNIEYKEGPIIYWMSRDQRVKDNWALLYAQQLAKEKNQPFGVVFVLQPNFLEASLRQYDFMIKGLQEIEKDLLDLNIPFILLLGDVIEELPKYVDTEKIGLLISDFSPLQIKKRWNMAILKRINCPYYEVDSHNIIPCWEASPKLEFGAYTLRPKINKVLFEYLTEFPKVHLQKIEWTSKVYKINWNSVYSSLKINKSVLPVDWLIPGEKEALTSLKHFISHKLINYSKFRNDPTLDFQSNLSPYLHFGHISAQRVVLEINKINNSDESIKAFLDELIVRKELSDNFCFYNDNYDSVEGFQNWAKTSLNEHLNDPREYLYSIKQFENCETHDPLWNAAQLQMMKTGKMHGYMRMYWAKKILEWSSTPLEAIKTAIYLNDKYELDGRDPNGYAGIAWSIGGTHDRAWFDRHVYGKIRYMNYNGCKSKFDVIQYINTYI